MPRERKLCEHGRRRNLCEDCGGASICEHGRQRRICKDCVGSGICEHGRERYKCKDCGGAGICPHGRQRCLCKDCGGASICEHGRQRNQCKDCDGAGICEHGRHRSKCGLCGGASVFKHHVRGLKPRGLKSELTETRYRWLIQNPCLYCGSPAGGVDRVKNEYGYTTLNSVPCCPKCNYAKRVLSAPEFVDLAHRIVAHSGTYETFKTRWIETRTTGPDLPRLEAPIEANGTSHTPEPQARAE